jgi:hypothetical protein
MTAQKTLNIGIYGRVTAQQNSEPVLTTTTKLAGYAQKVMGRILWDTKVDVRPFVVDSEEYTGHPTYMQGSIKQYIEANPQPDLWVPDKIAAFGGYHNQMGRCGEAQLGGKYAAIFSYPISCGSGSTTVHELFHTKRLSHAGTFNINAGERVEYGDGSSYMGNSTLRAGLNMPECVYLGLYTPEELVTITQPGEYVVAAKEIGKRSQRTQVGEWLGLVLDFGGDEFYLSLRKTTGHPDATVGEPSSKLYLHSRDRLLSKSTRYIPDLMPGNHMVVGGHSWHEASPARPSVPFKIEYLEYYREAALVRISTV